ncbi:MAG: ABC transporter, fused permease protein [uncultured Acidimicrobiales bacterium]|uniref:ABC transporter, fused permease protein n=1 Tax=uncultured Acidimicrobiales bacterium TaxID=310071 RepID=A0A6J4I4K8_9ACTN|nr:MAG: ABC transporter, fused permease protein [uncultured Acidimicrobiales bacterium]
MLKVSLKGLLAHKRRLLGTCSAVLLGVAFLAGTLVLGDTIRASFDKVFADATAGTDAVVRGVETVSTEMGTQRRLISEGLLSQLERVDGVALVVPQAEGLAQIIGSDGQAIGGQGPPTLAGNWVNDPALNPYRIAEGREPRAAGEVVIDRGAADLGKLQLGGSVEIRTPDPVQMAIVGIATFGAEADNLGGTTYVGLTLDQAQELLLRREGQVTSFAVRADDGVEQDVLVERLRGVLPEGSEVLSGAALAEELNTDINEAFLGFFETFLLIFTGVALLVATFSIYNTFSVILAQRTRESALLRAIGASRGQVLLSIAIEALVIGVVAAVLGIVAGVLLASALRAAMDAAGFGLPPGGLAITPATIVTSLVVGVVVTLLASLVPAIKASGVAPLAALRDVAIDRTGTSKVRVVLGAALTAVGVALVLYAALATELNAAGPGAVLTIIGVVVSGPVVAKPMSRVLGAPLRARGMSGRLARENAMRNPRRTASTATALMLGVGVVTLFTVIGASIKSSIDDAVSQAFAGDLVISSNNFSGSGISPDAVVAMNALPEVDTAAAVSFGPVRLAGEDRLLTAVNPAELAQVLDIGVTEGSLVGLRPDQFAVFDDLATEKGWQLGTRVPVTFPDGVSAELTVGAIYGSAEITGPLVLPAAALEPHIARPVITTIILTLNDGVSIDRGQAAVQVVADEYGTPKVLDRDEYVDSIAGQINQFLTVVYVLLALSIVIALMGIANTLSLSVHERTRELGLLRAVGQTRGQLRSMVRWESVIIAVFGTLGGVAIGLFIAWAVVKALADEGFNAFAAPIGQLLIVLVVGALVGVLAGIRPARRAAKLDVLRAISTG